MRGFTSVLGDSALVALQCMNTSGPPHPLRGELIAVKDNICVRDTITSCGSRILNGFKSSYDATVIQKLRSVGAVVVGKTNMDEFGMGSTTESSVYGVSNNMHCNALLS